VESTASLSDLHKSIKACARALALRHPRIEVEQMPMGIYASLTHIENGMEVLYVGVSDENFTSQIEALRYLDAVMRTDVEEAYNA